MTTPPASPGAPARATRRAGRRLARAAGALALVLVASCASRPRGGPAPVVHERAEGLEVATWVVDDAGAPSMDRWTLARTLAPYESRPTPFDDDRVALWRANGIRIVAVPRDDLDSIRARLALVGPVQEHRYGQLARWTPIAAGPAFEARTVVALDNGPLALKPGRARLLARAWAVPEEPEDGRPRAPMSASMLLELVPQHADRSDGASDLARALARAEDPEAQDEAATGLVVRRLALSCRTRTSDAIIVVADTPEADWSGATSDAAPAPQDGPPARGPSETSSDRRAPEQPPRTGAAARNVKTLRVDGVFERLPTLGDAMLSDALGANAGRRLVLVLSVKAPERFELQR